MSNFAPASDDLSTRLTWEQVEAIVDSSPCISTFAACEWSELSEDGKLWTVVFANEVLRRHSPTEPSRRETVGVTEEMIEAAARSDAAFDGRPIETLGRVERDRYRARAHRALNAALARTSPEVRGAEDVSDTGIERIDVPGGWYFQQVNEGGVVYALRTPSGKGFGIHGGGMSTYKTTVQAFVSSIESALSSPEHDDEVWELLQRAERAVAGKAANLKPWADKIPGRVNHWAVLRDEIYAAIRKENARRRAHVTPEAALASPPAQTWEVPDGWQLAPIDPTDEMLVPMHTALRRFMEHETSQLDLAKAWSDGMLAAPLPPVPAGEGK